jgi:hypothetical protein
MAAGPGDGTPELAPFTLGELLKVKVEYNTISPALAGRGRRGGALPGPVQNAISTRSGSGSPHRPDAAVDNIRVWGSFEECGSADLNDDGLLDLADVNAFVASFLGGCE